MNEKAKVSMTICAALMLIALLAFVFIKIFGGPLDEAEEEMQTPMESMASDTAFKEETCNFDSDIEDVSAVEVLTRNYVNSHVYSIEYAKGKILTVGVELPEMSNYIYINPHCSEATPENPVGFYITTSRCPVQVSDDEYLPLDSQRNRGLRSFIINHTYEQLAPSSYVDVEAYGVRWANDHLYDGTIAGGTSIYIRAINLLSYDLIALCRVEIEYSEMSDEYRVAGIFNSDVSETGELTEDERTAAALAAFEFFRNPDSEAYMSFENEPDWDAAMLNVFIEKVEAPYFDTLYDECSTPIKSGSITQDSIFAVSIPFPQAGFITIYMTKIYAPPAQIKIPDDVEFKYIPEFKVIGYDDPFSPLHTRFN